MKKNLLFCALILTAGSLLAADSAKDDVEKAAAKLGGQKNYSWKTTVETPNNSRFRQGPTEGKTEKGGYTTLAMIFGDNSTEAILKGTNGAIKLQDADWQTLAEAGQDNGGGFSPGMFLARMLQNYQMPDAQAAELAGETQDLKTGTNGISGDLTEAGAKSLLSFRPRGRNGGGNGPKSATPKAR